MLELPKLKLKINKEKSKLNILKKVDQKIKNKKIQKIGVYLSKGTDNQ